MTTLQLDIEQVRALLEISVQMGTLLDQCAAIIELADNKEVTRAEVPDQIRRILAERDQLVGEIDAANRQQPGPNEEFVDIDDAMAAKWWSTGRTVADGYEALAAILDEALEQASAGKGRERHANGLPFHHQPIITEALSVGLGFTAGQARKKILEAINCHDRHPARAEADLLGAINYTAATIISMRAMREDGGIGLRTEVRQ